MNGLPNIFSYTNHGDFLRDYFSARSLQGKVSLRSVAIRAGFRSPSSLSMIASGKRRLTIQAAEKIANALLLKGRSRQYWFLLAKKDSADSEQQKFEIDKKLARLKNIKNEQHLTTSQYQCLELWYVPVIYALIGKKDFNTEVSSFAKKIGRGLTGSKVAAALDSLEKLGLICKNGSSWVQTNHSVKTGEDTRNDSMRRYHAQMIAFAKSALSLPTEERDISALTVCIPKDCLPAVKNKIRQFRTDLSEYLSQFSEGEVFQINIQVFPMTKGERE